MTNKNNKKIDISRKLKVSKFKKRKVKKQIKVSRKPIGSAFSIMKGNLKHLYNHKKLFLSISLIYFGVSVILVTGSIGTADYSVLKESFQEVFNGAGGQLGVGISLFGVLLTGGASGSVSEAGSVYQSLLVVIISLVSIWALRKTYAKSKITLKDSFYKSMTPFVPFILVILVIGLQLLPLLLGTSIYSAAISQGLAASFSERVIWMFFVFLLFVLTIYLLSSSVFALYIVTLPDITPLQALRSAKELIRFRRFMVIRKFIFLPFSFLIMGAVIMIPILLYLTAVAQWIFIFLTMAGLVIAHGYMYRLYRELI